MNLFSDFSNLSTTYTPNNFQQKYPYNTSTVQVEAVSPNKPFEIIKNGQLVGYFWYQGNSIDLVFDISGTVTMYASDNYITAGDIASTLEFEASFYDFRGVKVLEFRNNPISEHQLIVQTDGQSIDNTQVIVPISAEISAKLVKGVYKLELVASHASGYRETIFGGDTATFEVR